MTIDYCWKWHRPLQIAMTVTNGIDHYKWQRPLQMASTVTNGNDRYKWHRPLQMTTTVTNGIDRYKWQRSFQMASTVTNGNDRLQKRKLQQRKKEEKDTVEPRFNELLTDRGNAFVLSRVREFENLDIPNLHENNQNVR